LAQVVRDQPIMEPEQLLAISSTDPRPAHNGLNGGKKNGNGNQQKPRVKLGKVNLVQKSSNDTAF
jgi:hypothetical protein